MSERRPFYSKFVWKEWISDTLDMTPEEAGAYIRLLAYAATNSPDCSSLPEDENRLARAVGVSVKTWRRLAGVVLLKFDYGAPGWKSKRLRADYDKYTQLVANQQKRRTGGAPERAKTGTGTSVRARASESESESESEVKTLGVGSSENKSYVEGVGGPGEEGNTPAAVRPPQRRRRGPRGPNANVRPEAIREYADRYGLTLEHVEHSAVKIRAEFDSRGYLNAESVLADWCRRDAKRGIGLRPTTSEPPPFDPTKLPDTWD